MVTDSGEQPGHNPAPQYNPQQGHPQQYNPAPQHNPQQYNPAPQYNPQQHHPQPYHPQQYNAPPAGQNWGETPAPASTNGWAICGLVVGIGSLLITLVFLLFGFFLFPVTVFGFVASIVGLRQIKRKQQSGTGIAVGGIIFNAITLVIQIVTLVLAIMLFGGLLWFGANVDEFCESGDLDCTTPSTTISPAPADDGDSG